MVIGASAFKETNPTAENINILVSASKVVALTVSTTDCNLNNFQGSLSVLETITIDTLNNGNPIIVTSVESREGYYYYNVTPFDISTTIEGDSCLTTAINPFLEAVGFANSDFNILFNNASDLRTSSYIIDVDRKKDSIVPSNMDSILDGTALKASIPDSYYSSLAHTSGRYIGTKTSEEEYGISPALGVKFFEGAEYLTGVASGSICNELLSDRKLEVFVYSGNFDTPVNGDRIFRAEGNKALPLRNRQVWVRANTTVYLTDEEGYISNSGTLCSS